MDIINSSGSKVTLYEEFIGNADYLCDKFRKELDWREEEVIVFGRKVMQPRRIYACGDPGVKHKYSGLTLDLMPWIPEAEHIKCCLEQLLNTEFNSCLLNEYASGKCYVGYHSDKEIVHPIVATVSLGGPRDFLIRNRYGEKNTIKIPLYSGDVLVMSGKCQEQYVHTVPKRSKANYRISLTYRMLAQ